MIERSVPILISAYRHGHRGLGRALLHDHVAPSLADLSESMLGQESANLLAREGPQPTQPRPQDASRTPRCVGGS